MISKLLFCLPLIVFSYDIALYHCISFRCFTKVQVVLNFLVIKNKYHQNLYMFFSQVDIFHTTECHIYIFHFSHFNNLALILGHSLEKFENDLISCKAFFTEVCFFLNKKQKKKKTLCHQHRQYIGIHDLKCWFHQCFCLTG